MTRSGVVALATGLVLTGLGWALVWPPLAALGSTALVLVVAGLVYAARPARLEIERQVHPARVAKGTEAIVYLRFVNHGRSELPRTRATQPFGSGSIRLVVPRLAGGQAGVRTYRLPTERRGVFDLGPLEVTRADPFALARSVRHHGGTEQIWVYPRIFSLRALRSGHDRSFEGPDSETADEGTITFHRVREYATGDDLRMIHWKSTARTGRLMVRHNVDTSQPLTVVLFDLRPSLYSEESFEVAVDLAASVVSCSSLGRSPVELRTTDGVRLGGPDAHEAQPLVDHLAAVVPSADGSVNEQLQLVRRQRTGTALVVITGVFDRDDLPAVASLRRRFQRLVVISVTPEPVASTHYPGVRVLSGTAGEEIAGLWNLDTLR